MKIQQVAAQTGLSIHTLRYYEQIGLVGAVGREHNGHRSYDVDDVYRIRFVMSLRAAGMPIAEIKRYVELAAAGDGTIAARLELLEEHRATVTATVAELQEHLLRISQKIAHYRELYAADLAQPR